MLGHPKYYRLGGCRSAADVDGIGEESVFILVRALGDNTVQVPIRRFNCMQIEGNSRVSVGVAQVL